MNLAQHLEESLEPGSYTCQIMSFNEGQSSKKLTPFVEFHLSSIAGEGAVRATFYLTDAAYSRLASFAYACGMTKAELANYSHGQLIGRRVGVALEPEEGRVKVARWYAVDQAAPAPPPVQREERRETPKAEDDLPF
jgi:hypothetical protein